MIWFFAGLSIGVICAWVGVQYFRQNARVLEEEKQRLEQERTLVLEFMHNLVAEVSGDSSKKDLHRRIVHAAVLGTGAVSGALYVPTDRQSMRTAAVVGFFPPQKALGEEEGGVTPARSDLISRISEGEELGAGEGIIGEVARTGEIVLINNPDEDPRIVRHPDPMLRVRALLVVPMFFRKRFVGIVAVANPADGMGFSETDSSLVVSLAEQAALAIHNADQMHLQIERQRLDIDLSLAANIQRMLLPGHLPDVSGVELAAVYQTAQQVGGDMYSIISLPEGRTGIGIADVSGKGIAASLLMAICQTSLSHIAREEVSASRVLSLLNASIIDSIRADMFVTMIYAVIDPVSRTVRIARAGHELPVLVSRTDANGKTGGGTCSELFSEGMALGMVPNELFEETIEEKTVPFGPEDLMVLYTDGITERVNRSEEEYSTDRLLDVIRSEKGSSPEDLKSSILGSVESFSEGLAPPDDMTLLVVKGTNSN